MKEEPSHFYKLKDSQIASSRMSSKKKKKKQTKRKEYYRDDIMSRHILAEKK